MQYIVKNAVKDKEQIAGEKSYSPTDVRDYLGEIICAESESEAINIAIDSLADVIEKNGTDNFDVDREDKTITIYENGAAVMQYLNFTAVKLTEAEQERGRHQK